MAYKTVENEDGTTSFIPIYSKDPPETSEDPADTGGGSSGGSSEPPQQIIASGPVPGSMIYGTPEGVEDVYKEYGSSPPPSGGWGGVVDRQNFTSTVNYLMKEEGFSREQAEATAMDSTTPTQNQGVRYQYGDYTIYAKNQREAQRALEQHLRQQQQTTSPAQRVRGKITALSDRARKEMERLYRPPRKAPNYSSVEGYSGGPSQKELLTDPASKGYALVDIWDTPDKTQTVRVYEPVGAKSNITVSAGEGGKLNKLKPQPGPR